MYHKDNILKHSAIIDLYCEAESIKSAKYFWKSILPRSFVNFLALLPPDIFLELRRGANCTDTYWHCIIFVRPNCKRFIKILAFNIRGKHCLGRSDRSMKLLLMTGLPYRNQKIIYRLHCDLSMLKYRTETIYNIQRHKWGERELTLKCRCIYTQSVILHNTCSTVLSYKKF